MLILQWESKNSELRLKKEQKKVSNLTQNDKGVILISQMEPKN